LDGVVLALEPARPASPRSPSGNGTTHPQTVHQAVFSCPRWDRSSLIKVWTSATTPDPKERTPMKKLVIAALVAAGLALGAVGTAQAGWWHYSYHYSYHYHR
jgi:hypothetical protein